MDIANNKLFKRVTLHLAQSEYARDYLSSNGIHNSVMLGDYSHPIYLDRTAHPDVPRENIVAYNPRKGLAAARKILPLIKNGRAVALENMTRQEIVDLLLRAKVYIDFGNHPGMDRFPREAAALGTCVVTNRRGSAANAIDVPIPDMYKIDDTSPGFGQQAAAMIDGIFTDFAAHSANFVEYRNRIVREPESFRAKVAKIFVSSDIRADHLDSDK